MKEIVANLSEREASYVLVGDYGAGKSMTTREIFNHLAARFQQSKSRVFPILLNLRDHQGQTDPVEALERHARRIGYDRASDLVRAWRSGYAVLLMDGFDELAALGWSEKSRKLREIRHRSMELVRRFIADSPATGGVLLTGRLHYFDSPKEMIAALGLDWAFQVLSLNDFSVEQVQKYLSDSGWNEEVPAWLPSRPFLLSYLVSSKLLEDVLSVESGLSAAAGWDRLLTGICNREAAIEAGIDGDTVRRVVERLGTIAREKPSGVGPLSPSDLISAFTQVCGYSPDDRALVILQRLPGLGAAEGDESARVFIDNDLAEAAKAGDVYAFLVDPYTVRLPPELGVCLGELGCQSVAHRASGMSEGQYVAAAQQAERIGAPLVADIVRSMHIAGIPLTKQRIVVEGVWLPQWTFTGESVDLSMLVVRGAVVEELLLASLLDLSSLPRFEECSFGKITGRAGPDDLPEERFQDCEASAYVVTAQNTAELMRVDIPLGARVLLTILEKIYLQRGSGRVQGALYRGLDGRGQAYVDPCVELVRKHRYAVQGGRGDSAVWHPVRARSGEVQRMLASPIREKFEILAAAWELDC
ncbi:MAG: hypothetical protein V4850_11985 [Myxococcota bacterium]